MLLRLLCITTALCLFSAHILADDALTSAVADAARPDYVLEPFDLIHVVVFQELDLERQVRLTQESTVTLPLIGTVSLKNKTVREAQDLIRELYDRDYLVNPQINIGVIEYAKVTVNVLGAVERAGAILIPPDQPLTLLDAITQAGGFTRLADRKHVRLTRMSKDGQGSTTIVINADEIIQSTTADKWPLQKNDMIYVPERIL